MKIFTKKGILVLIPTIAITYAPEPNSIQFYWLNFRIAIVWGDF